MDYYFRMYVTSTLVLILARVSDGWQTTAFTLVALAGYLLLVYMAVSDLRRKNADGR